MSVELQDVLLSLVIAILGIAARWIAKRVEMSDTKAEAIEAILLAVNSVRQTYVDDLKAAAADGTLTDSEKAEARRRAGAIALQLVGPKAAELIKSWGEEKLRAYIEAMVAKG